MASRARWTWCFSWTRFGGWGSKWNWVGGPSSSDLWLWPPQLSRVKFTNDVVDVENEDLEVISSEQETNGRTNGVGRSDRAVSSTLSSKAGIILVSLLQYDWQVILVISLFFISIGHSQYLYCHSPIPRHWIGGYYIFPSWSPKTIITKQCYAREIWVERFIAFWFSGIRFSVSRSFNPPPLSFFGLGADLSFFSSICGVAACLAFILCWRLAREIRHR